MANLPLAQRGPFRITGKVYPWNLSHSIPRLDVEFSWLRCPFHGWPCLWDCGKGRVTFYRKPSLADRSPFILYGLSYQLGFRMQPDPLPCIDVWFLKVDDIRKRGLTGAFRSGLWSSAVWIYYSGNISNGPVSI